jgi:hypothetical protein
MSAERLVTELEPLTAETFPTPLPSDDLQSFVGGGATKLDVHARASFGERGTSVPR